ncbi:MAG: FtsX-like permease family protein, partial [Hoylesella buccalis]
IGVAVATMALVIVMSVFNGFHDLVASFLTNFDPQLEVVPTEGKSANANDPLLTKVKQLRQVDVATENVEDMAMAMYGDKLTMVTIKGVDDNFDTLTHIKEILYGDGEYELHAGNLEYGIIGIRLAQTLDVGATWNGYLKIYAPKRSGQLDMNNPASGFAVDSLLSPGVVFSVNQARYDKGHILTSIEFARNLFDMKGRISSLELRLQENSNLKEVKKEIQAIVGSRYKVLDRFEQQADTFKIMQIEKIIAYFFLTFILVVACFNIIGSLSMLMIDKKNDVVTLRNIGASDKQITKIFLFEGRMISVIGALIGILLGLLLCWLQQTFGFVSLGQRSGDFVVNAYPVSVHYLDILFIFITVIAVGWMAVWYPVRYFSKRLLANH